MIRMSTKGRYGARLMLELALKYGRGPVLLKEIAKNQEISEGYLEHILLPLKAAGLVNSTRGAHGGYSLARPPEEINLSEIIQKVEGSLAFVECVTAPEVCSRSGLCATRDVWGSINKKLIQVLESTTLQDLVEQQKQKQHSQPLMYSI